ncbi:MULTISPECIES: hypothetical protein [Flavobacterium]|jgi:viroplasmin and RNaseH domain-containing protein|uniref:Uncharacterized protein n=1 Tax=Flavobacterium jumunjinense TaxID=998845 RepID=A0ABV5GQD1_9FLAO|nr:MULTISPECIES: hypothetical protein [Flavobacterium]
MSYSISSITQVADCDVLLTWAGKEKAELEFKKLSEERLTSKYEDTSVEVEAILQGVIAEISAIDTVISVLPDGPTKEDQIKNKRKLEYKKFVLENRKESYGAVALLEKELDLERVTKELEEVNAFITVITNHKATL